MRVRREGLMSRDILIGFVLTMGLPISVGSCKSHRPNNLGRATRWRSGIGWIARPTSNIRSMTLPGSVRPESRRGLAPDDLDEVSRPRRLRPRDPDRWRGWSDREPTARRRDRAGKAALDRSQSTSLAAADRRGAVRGESPSNPEQRTFELRPALTGLARRPERPLDLAFPLPLSVPTTLRQRQRPREAMPRGAVLDSD